MTDQVLKLGVYKHYKDKYYKVIKLAKHADTEQDYVVYQLLYGDFSFWIRTLDDFVSRVNVGGVWVSRFAFVSESDDFLSI